MKALVYEGVGQKAWKEKERPAIEQPTDAIVRVTHTTICGTDLHIPLCVNLNPYTGSVS